MLNCIKNENQTQDYPERLNITHYKIPKQIIDKHHSIYSPANKSKGKSSNKNNKNLFLLPFSADDDLRR